MNAKYRYLAIGMVIGIAVVGCIAGVITDPEKVDEGRFEFHLMHPMSVGSDRNFVVLDSQTGTAISWQHGNSEPQAVHPFYEE